jgi:hypothetical protein
MENKIKIEVISKEIIKMTPARLREIASEIDRARAKARRGDTTMVHLSENVILAYDDEVLS